MKAPDGGHVDGHACMHSHMDIGRASLYEHAGRQPGIRIPAAIAAARSAEQSAYYSFPARSTQASSASITAPLIPCSSNVLTP